MFASIYRMFYNNILCSYYLFGVLVLFITFFTPNVSKESYISVTVYNPTLYQLEYDIPPGYSPGTYVVVLGHVGGNSVSKASTSTDTSGSSILRDLDPEVAPGDLLYATLALQSDQDTIINEIRHRTGNTLYNDKKIMQVSSAQILWTLISYIRYVFVMYSRLSLETTIM